VRRFLIACPLLLVAVAISWGAEDTKKAADTRKLLKTKVTFKWKDTSFGDVLDEIKEKVEGIRIHRDEKAINVNKQITYMCKDKPLEDVFAELLGKSGWGYYVNSKKDAYDGDIYIRVGEERGYPKGEEPGPGDKPKDKPKEEKPKDKPKIDDKPKEEKPKEKPAEDDPDKAEKDAARKLKLAKLLIEDKMLEGARDALEEIIKKYKETKAAAEAKELLKKLDQ